MIEEITIERIPIKLSVKDQNMIALMWMAEIVTRAVIEDAACAIKVAPPGKEQLYAYVASVFAEAHEKIMGINTALENQAVKTFSEEYTALLVDVTNAFVSLYDSMSLKSILAVLKSAGVSTEYAGSYKKGLSEIVNRSTNG